MPVLPLPNYTPEFPITKSVKPRQRSAQLPSWGIEQRATSGLNQTAPEWNPRWVLSTADADILDAFLEARASSGNEWIQWTDPDGNPGLFRCDDWTKQLIACEISEVQATFRRVFDISVVVVFDPDAAAYIAAVEAADGQPLEPAVKTAINSFVVGCKADGIWAAIKAACILAGARTLSGALVPLAGTAPTNFNFWGDADPSWANVSLLLRMNGANASTTFSDSSDNALAVSRFGNAQISTAQSKFSGASGLFDGNGDYLSYAYNAALDLIGSAFTVETWIYPTAYKASGMRIMAAGGGAVAFNGTTGIHFLVQLDSSGRLQLQYWNGSAVQAVTHTTVVALSAWSHVAVSVSGTNIYLAVDGVVQSFTVAAPVRPSTNPIFTAGTINGEDGGSTTAFNGNMDDLRITKGVARYQSTFTPRTQTLPGSTADYTRKTGLVGNGSTKYLNSNRSQTADPQDNHHLATQITTTGTGALIGVRAEPVSSLGDSLIGLLAASDFPFQSRISAFNTPAQGTRSAVNATGFVAVSRSSSSSLISRLSGASETITSTSITPLAGNIGVFAQIRADTSSIDNYSNARLAFYSIGESLNLALLDARVTTLINAIAAAIP